MGAGKWQTDDYYEANKLYTVAHAAAEAARQKLLVLGQKADEQKDKESVGETEIVSTN